MMKTKICTKCGEIKTVDQFHCAKKGKYGVEATCRDCKAQYGKIYYANHKEEKKQWFAKRYQRLKDSVFNAYGGYVCACCGETEPLFLTIDHIKNNGSRHRKEIYEESDRNTDDYRSMSGVKTYQWLEKNGFPPGYQVLCANCNQGKYRNGGICPHHSKGSTTIPEGSTPQAIGGGSAEPLLKTG